MAGLDGIQNKIHPGEAASKDLYHLPPEEDALIPTVCASLEEALDNLNKDREFLTRGGVFTDSMIDAYIELKMQDVQRMRMTTSSTCTTRCNHCGDEQRTRGRRCFPRVFLWMLYIRDGCLHPRITNDNELQIECAVGAGASGAAHGQIYSASRPAAAWNSPTSTAAAIAS
jgi:hypothetical protein